MRPLPTPRKAPRQARSQHMVEQILQATARILEERGYAGMNTNAVAARAGVSVGSVYQYFPNKDSLITALHERHGAQMYAAIDAILDGEAPRTLREHLAAMVHAWLVAHQVEPELHKVLEKEFPFFDAPSQDSAADNNSFQRILRLLERHKDDIGQPDPDLATWMLLRMMESLVHAAVMDAPPRFAGADIERGIVDALEGFLRAGSGGQGALA
ncbi:TetR/AcrR family transcriptional regulator [Massilia antarctica]|uniref:TetR/AcrR family transcriptional regulator n=1 Tax=Massilia antarctica TaxID=2765360 RepID=A0AA48W7I6_9BURK|nr:TetR/AcrR family transcriptional regulator [Massilia antarctica]QPI47772.1 TetR/AcrR family transcriptional regulator [Massilia antarctica]